MQVGLLHVAILNLPPLARHDDKNICTPAILEKEPALTINGVTSFFVETLSHLFKDGMWVHTADGKKMILKALLYVATADNPAKCKCWGTPHHMGRRPCNNCAVHGGPGTSFADVSTFPARTHSDIVASLKLVEQRADCVTRRDDDTSHIAGGFRWTPFYKLPYWDAVHSMAFDLMHALAEGVLKYFLSVFASAYGDPLIAGCNALISDIKAGSGVSRKIKNSLPAGLMERIENAKAHEILVFVNCVSEHCLQPFISAADYTVWTMVVAASRFLCAYRALKSQIPLHRAIYKTAIFTFHRLHPSEDLKPNSHFVDHLFDNVQRFGPSPTTWCFPFERMMGRVDKLSFSSSRTGVIRTIAKHFRAQMFTVPLLHLGRHFSVISEIAIAKASRLLDSDLGVDSSTRTACGRWHMLSVTLVTLEAAARRNFTMRSLGMEHEDLVPEAKCFFIDRPSSSFVLPVDPDLFVATPNSWQATLALFLKRNKLTEAVQLPTASCFQHIRFGESPESLLRLSAPNGTWNLGSGVRGPNAWREGGPVSGSVVEVDFLVRSHQASGSRGAAGGSAPLQECSYVGQVLTFVEVCFKDSPDKLRLAYCKWHKNLGPREQLAAVSPIKLINPKTGQLPPPSAPCTMWSPSPPRTVSASCYTTDEWVPVNRIKSRVALLPFQCAPGSTVKKYRVLRID